LWRPKWRTMKNLIQPYLFLILLVGAGLIGCDSYVPSKSDLSQHNFIPKPTSVEATGSSFLISKSTVISVHSEDSQLLQVADQLSAAISEISNLKVPIQVSDSQLNKGISIEFTPVANIGTNDGYKLQISEDEIELSSGSPAGIFYGVQTLKRLLPLVPLVAGEQLEIPTGTIVDHPNFEHRGSMLDVARHFFSVADVKRYIDLISMYKMNVLHIHIADDQGWRIEIKSWPNLTAHGSRGEVGGGAGGFYTQEEYKDIVAYAADRFITIIPEIDMPGHTNAALSSYPELNCDGIAPEMRSDIDVGYSTLCVRKELTYKFVDDVIREMAAITPGPYIHVGGDESHVTSDEDYVYFVNRAQDIVNKHGKLMIGWDEVANADLKSGNVAQHWNFKNQAKAAAKAGAKIIMSPAKKAYMDMKYDSTTVLGLKWANMIEVDTAYMWDPEDFVPGVDKSAILGVEAPLWSETITTMDEIEFLAFPRLAAYAELAWTPKDQRSWDDFKVRLGKEQSRYDAMDIDFYKSPRIPWVEESMTVKEVKN